MPIPRLVGRHLFITLAKQSVGTYLTVCFDQIRLTQNNAGLAPNKAEASYLNTSKSVTSFTDDYNGCYADWNL